MSSTLRLRIAVAVMAIAACGAQAAPTRVSANAGEVRDYLATSATTMFAATQGGGLYKTTTTGANWSWVSTFPGRYVWKLAQSPAAAARLYAATNSGIYASTDTGATWTQITGDPTRAIAVSPGSTAGADTLIAGVTGVGLIKSTDSGATWARLGDATFYGASGLDPRSIAFASATDVYAGFECNRSDFRYFNYEAFGGIYRSTNSGTNWSSLQTIGAFTIPTKCVTTVVASTTTVPAGLTVLVGTKDVNLDGKIYRSFNGAQWTNPIAPGDGYIFGIETLSVDRNTPNTFWVGTRTFGVWKSTGGAAPATWAQSFVTATDPDVNMSVYALGTFPGNATAMIGVKGLGAFRSTTGASPWTPPVGITADRVVALTNHNVAAPGTYYTALMGGGFMKSTDSGATWTQVNGGLIDAVPSFDLNATGIVAHPTVTSVVYGTLLSQSNFVGGLHTLNVGTSTWNTASNLTGDNTTTSLAISGSTGSTWLANFNGGANGGLLAGSSSATLVSTGYPLDIVETPGVVAPGAYRIRASPGNSNLVFLLMYDSPPYRTANGGGTWARVVAPDASPAFMRSAFFEIAEKPGNPAIQVASTNKGIFRSVDSGASFSRLASTGLLTTALQALAYASNGILWAGDRGGNMYCSVNDGVSFVSVPLGGLPPVAFTEAKYINGAMHFSTDGGGVYKNASTTCP